MGNYKQISLAIDSTLNVNGSGQLQVASSIAGAAGVEATRAEAAEATIAGNLTSHAELTTTAHGGIVANTDSRLTDARTPTAHAATHEAGGSDPLPIGTANGIASLDNSGKVPLTQLPSGVWIYEGVWNAATNTPMLVNGTGAVGELYVVSTAGTHDFGAGAQTFSGSELCIYNGSVWERSASGNNVVTVNGYAGAVVLAAADVGADASGSAAAAQSAAESFATSAIAAAAPPAWTVLDSTTPIAVQSTLDPAAYDTLADYLAALGPLGSNGFFQLTVCTGDLGDQSFENAITGYNGSDNNPLVGDVYQWTA